MTHQKNDTQDETESQVSFEAARAEPGLLKRSSV